MKQDVQRAEPTVEDWLESGGQREFTSQEQVYDWSCFAHDFLGFCGCGCPSEAVRYLLGILKSIESWSDFKGPFGSPENQALWKARDDAVGLGEDGGSNVGLYYVLMYWLDDREWLEHGSGVGGSWLTDKGKTAIKVLERFIALEGEEEEDEKP